MFSNITADWFKKIYATDASNQKGGIIEARVPKEVQKVLESDRMGAYTHLCNPFHAILRQIGETEDDQEAENPFLAPAGIQKFPPNVCLFC